MVVTECLFNPERDMKPVENFGFVDLKNALVNNVVPSNMADSESDYNGIDDPASIVGRPDDVFDALRAQSEIYSRAESVSKESNSD